MLKENCSSYTALGCDYQCSCRGCFCGSLLSHCAASWQRVSFYDWDEQDEEGRDKNDAAQAHHNDSSALGQLPNGLDGPGKEKEGDLSERCARAGKQIATATPTLPMCTAPWLLKSVAVASDRQISQGKELCEFITFVVSICISIAIPTCKVFAQRLN